MSHHERHGESQQSLVGAARADALTRRAGSGGRLNSSRGGEKDSTTFKDSREERKDREHDRHQPLGQGGTLRWRQGRPPGGSLPIRMIP